MLSFALAILLNQSLQEQLEKAQAACAVDPKQCAQRDKIARQVYSEKLEADEKRRQEEQKAYEDRTNAEIAAEEQAEQERQAKLKKRCGKDYKRIKVGMKFERFKLCSGFAVDDFEVRAQDERGAVYEVNGGLLRVENGIIRRWIAPAE